MNAVNFDAVMLRMLAGAEDKRLLLHACCAPCASYCLTQTAPRTRVTAFFYNPNLDSAEEYEKRLHELRRLTEATKQADVLDTGYRHEDFAAAAAGFEDAPEGGARCERCFRLRLFETARMAKSGGFDLFATTLTVSPLKNAALINRIGSEAAEAFGVEYLPTDFKKRGGYLQSVQLSRQYGLYRQNYCGCEFSRRILQDK
ncbi:MAG TPA: epoxyqueuosine reductase QueH [Firmicutes bacterium]|nr:epoxyqueuosine reductase QueH [Bacillota bacterium]